MWWKKSKDDDGSPRCSFCGKSQEEVERFIRAASALPRAFICNECIELCYRYLQEARAEEAKAKSATA